MSAVTLRPRGKGSQAAGARGRGRRYFGLTVGLLAQAVGVSATLGAGGCDSNQYVLITVQGLPAPGTVSVRTLYQLDTSPDKKGIAWVAPPEDHFAIKFPGDTKGTLTATVQAFSLVSAMECYQAMAVKTLQLDGSLKQELTISLPAKSQVVCDATHVAATFPPAAEVPLASWGDSPTNIWVVGDQGLILHWDGTSLAPVKLPDDLSAKPPTWRAVSGAGSNYVWVAGDQGAVARWDGTKFTTVSLVGMDGSAVALTGDARPSWVSLGVADATKDEVFFASSNGYIGHNQASIPGVQVLTDVQTYPIYPVGSAQGPMSKTIAFSDVYCVNTSECWLVGYDPSAFAVSGQSGAGMILQTYTPPDPTNPTVYSDYSMQNMMTTLPVTRNRLRGVWGYFTPYGQAATRKLYVVGENATLLTSENSISSAIPVSEPLFYPKFQTSYSLTAMTFLQGKSQKLNAIGGTGTADLSIAGDAGLLVHWDATPAGSATPFKLIDTGVTSNFTNVFSTGPSTAGGRVYLSGDHQTFISP